MPTHLCWFDDTNLVGLRKYFSMFVITSKFLKCEAARSIQYFNLVMGVHLTFLIRFHVVSVQLVLGLFSDEDVRLTAEDSHFSSLHEQIFCRPPLFPDWLWCPPSLLHDRYWWLFPWG